MRTARKALCCIPRVTCSIEHYVGFSGKKASSHAAYNAGRLLFVNAYPPLYITRYLFIQLNEQERRRVNETGTRFEAIALLRYYSTRE